MDHNQIPGVLSSIFGGKPVPPAEMFAHPEERNILVTAIDILKQSSTGAHLLGILNEKDIGVRVIKHRNAHGYTPSEKMIFLGAPPTLKEADSFVVIEFAAGIREVEQELVGFTLPPEGADPLEIASVRHAKTLDIVAYMCRVSIELAVETGSTAYIETMKSLGYDEALRMYVAQADDKKVTKAYDNAQ
jgi:hypothetical protein